MQNWEFEVVNLKTEHDANDRRRFRWHCRRHSNCVDQDGLESLLNDMGREGWSVVSHDTDSRWGSTLVLTRALPDNDQQPKRTPNTVNAEPIPPPAPIIVSAPPVDLAPLLVEIQALRADLLSHANLRVPAPDIHVQPVVNFEGLNQSLAPIFAELRSLKQSPAAAVLSPDAVDRLTRALERSVVQAVEMAIAPRLISAPQAEPKFERKRFWPSWSWVTGIGR